MKTLSQKPTGRAHRTLRCVRNVSAYIRPVQDDRTPYKKERRPVALPQWDLEMVHCLTPLSQQLVSICVWITEEFHQPLYKGTNCSHD